MGVAIQCILEQEPPGVEHMEGKSLAVAYCSDPGGPEDADAEPASNVVAVEFGGSKAAKPPSNEESPLAPLTPFIAGDGGFEWHEASAGLKAVRSILEKLRAGAQVSVAPDFEFWEGDDQELTEGVIYDLEMLEETLLSAEKAQTRFYLMFDV
jgi:hypothetical protein